MAWQKILISNPARLSCGKGRLIIEQEERVSLPLEDIEIILIDTPRVSLTSSLLKEVATFGIALLICDDTHHPSGIFTPFFPHHKQGEILKKQVTWTEPFKKRSRQMLIKQKIKNQSMVLKLSNKTFPKKEPEKLYHLAENVDSGDRENREGEASRIYFPALFGKGFKRSDETSLNGLLNYGYALLRATLSRHIAIYGFIPGLGLFHKSELNRFNLSDDLIEPFRPFVDLFVFTRFVLPETIPEILDTKTKTELLSILDLDIKVAGKRYILSGAMEHTVISLKRATLKNEYKLLELPVLEALQTHSYE